MSKGTSEKQENENTPKSASQQESEKSQETKKQPSKHTGLKIAVVTLCRLVLGMYFTIFGLLRANMPVGGTYKVYSYLESAGLDFFKPTALLMTILFAAFEFTIGVCSVLGTNIKKTSLYTILLFLFLTPFTFYTAYFNPVQKDDTFGDILWVDDKPAFWMSVACICIAILIYVWRKYSKTIYTTRTQWLIGPICMCFSFLISAISLIDLPFFDVSAYRTGVNLSRYIPSEGKGSDQGEFDQDDLFTIENQERVARRNGGTASAIQLFDSEKRDVTREVLTSDKYTLLLVAPDLRETRTEYRHVINKNYEYAREHGYPFYCLTASPINSQAAEEYIVESCGAEYPFLNGDHEVLCSMIQANPGLMLMKDGIIYRKWSMWGMPTFEAPLDTDKNGTIESQSNYGIGFKMFLHFIAIMALILAIDWILGGFKWTGQKIVSLFKKKK